MAAVGKHPVVKAKATARASALFFLFFFIMFSFQFVVSLFDKCIINKSAQGKYKKSELECYISDIIEWENAKKLCN